MAEYANPNHPGSGLLSRVVEHAFNTNLENLYITNVFNMSDETSYDLEVLDLERDRGVHELQREVFEDGTRGAPRIQCYIPGYISPKGSARLGYGVGVVLNQSGDWVYETDDVAVRRHSRAYLAASLFLAKVRPPEPESIFTRHSKNVG